MAEHITDRLRALRQRALEFAELKKIRKREVCPPDHAYVPEHCVSRANMRKKPELQTKLDQWVEEDKQAVSSSIRSKTSTTPTMNDSAIELWKQKVVELAAFIPAAAKHMMRRPSASKAEFAKELRALAQSTYGPNFAKLAAHPSVRLSVMEVMRIAKN